MSKPCQSFDPQALQTFYNPATLRARSAILIQCVYHISFSGWLMQCFQTFFVRVYCVNLRYHSKCIIFFKIYFFLYRFHAVIYGLLRVYGCVDRQLYI